MSRAWFDAAWRASLYCLHPRVIALSLLPLMLSAGLALAWGYFFWERAVDAVRDAMTGWSLSSALFDWLQSIGAPGLKAVFAPLVVVFLATPVLVLVALLAVAGMMGPALQRLVARRRFAQLERRHGGSVAAGLLVGAGASLIALLAMLASIPLWFVPPLALIIPPLIWGWLTYRVMSYDMLAEHADKDERRTLMARHRPALIGIGVLCGYLGAAPSLLWASGALFLAFAPVLLPLAVWIYTLVFAFSALWYAHYLLAALRDLRAEREGGRALAGGGPGAELVR